MPQGSQIKAEPAERRLRKRRDEIIDAAAQVFAELGYHAASTRNIADVLGMKQGSLYYYFSSKEHALYEVCLIGVQGFLEGFEEICTSELPVPDKVRAGILNHMLPLRARQNYVRVFLRDRNLISGAERREILNVVRAYEDLWDHLVRRGQEVGTFRGELTPKTVSFAIIGMCNAAAAWIDPDAPGEIERVAGEFAQLVLNGMGLNRPD